MVKQSGGEQLEQKCSYWKQHIDSWQETGLTQVEYCRQHNLKHHQLVYWKKRIIKTETDVSFVSLKFEDLLDRPAPPEHASLSVVINNHFKIEIRAGFDAQLSIANFQLLLRNCINLNPLKVSPPRHILHQQMIMIGLLSLCLQSLDRHRDKK